MTNDYISNLIIKIKNAGKAGITTISFPYSKYIESILNLLEKEGFIKSFAKKGKKVIKSVDIEIAYEDDKTPKVTEAIRLSKLSKRTYKGAKEIGAVRSGYGIMVLTTSKGVLTSTEARKMRVGGEPLFKIW